MVPLRFAGSLLSFQAGTACAAGAGAGDDGLHDLGRAVADLEAEHVAQPLLHRPAVVAAVAVHQQALMDGIVGELRAPTTCTWRPPRCAARPCP